MGRAGRWSVAGGPGFALAERVAQTVADHAMFQGGESVVVAVSGGPDSTCLLHVLARLGADLTLLVAHVDHGLSESAEEVSAAVAKQAAANGFDVHVARAKDLEGPNLHARARDFRYAFFEVISQQESAGRIATGHTLDDRVETTLARLVHGAGTRGLSGIPPLDDKRVRPLIDVRRSETRAYCDEVGLAYVDDPANDDVRFERAFLRRRVLPSIEERWGDGAIRAMANSSELLREDAVALDNLADRLYAGLATTEQDGIHLDLKTVGDMPPAFRRRILERAVGPVRDRSGGIAAALSSLDARDGSELHFDLAQGIAIDIKGDHILVSHPAGGRVDDGEG